jgi:hypothetical protein
VGAKAVRSAARGDRSTGLRQGVEQNALACQTMRQPTSSQLSAIAGGLALGMVAVLVAVWQRQPPRVAPHHADLTGEALRRLNGFTVYGVGRGIDGLALAGNQVDRHGPRVDTVTLEYGDCVFGSSNQEPSCSYPLVLQSSRRGDSTRSTPRQIRQFGARIEVSTPSTRLIIWGRSPQVARHALAALHPIN